MSLLLEFRTCDVFYVELSFGKLFLLLLFIPTLTVCHAEMNAIMNKNSSNLSGCIIYVALFPCNECAKLIIQAGIKEVVFYSDKRAKKKSTKASKRMLDMAGVICR